MWQQVKSTLSYFSETDTNQITDKNLHHNVDYTEVEQHGSGIFICIAVIFPQQEKYSHDNQQSKCIGLDNITNLKPAALYSLCRIHVKCQIQHQIQRYNSSQSHHIKDKPKSRWITQNYKLIDPGQKI